VRLAQRIVLNSFVVATILMATVLVAVERRVTERVRAGEPSATWTADDLLSAVRRDIVIAGGAALLVGVLLAQLLARSVARPIEELRDVARGIAAGDLTQRPSRNIVGGEVGDLADAVRRVAEQLEARLQALQAEEALLVALTESLNEGVIAVDARQRVVRINDTARQLLRLREPVPFPADYLPRDRVLRDALAAVLAGEEAVPGEARIDDRTMSLTARPLLEAVRRDFVANVSHELRTPLTIINGFVETLQDDDEMPAALRQQFLGMAATNVRRMQRIVDDLLDLSRIESGGWLPNPSELDLNSLAVEIFAPLQSAAAEKGVALRSDLQVATVYCDPTAARQVLSNLSENALRHTTAGEVVLFAEPSDDGVWLGVRDTGSGIGAEHLPRIFERFYRADPGRSREAGGTGLGLSIVRHLAEAHGGRVKAESAPGEGTTIAALFPAA
jgi:two-component system, OmpR family, phosphate regulon sensor histidine kinase PhoR